MYFLIRCKPILMRHSQPRSLEPLYSAPPRQTEMTLIWPVQQRGTVNIAVIYMCKELHNKALKMMLCKKLTIVNHPAKNQKGQKKAILKIGMALNKVITSHRTNRGVYPTLITYCAGIARPPRKAHG